MAFVQLEGLHAGFLAVLVGVFTEYQDGSIDDDATNDVTGFDIMGEEDTPDDIGGVYLHNCFIVYCFSCSTRTIYPPIQKLASRICRNGHLF